MLKAAFMSAEDKNFYNHGGIDFMGLGRAVLTNIKYFGSDKRMIGASTITQQVAKNFLLTSERSMSRKIREALLALKMEKTFTKDHILELYLNEIYLGVGSYGVASASLNYFDKSMDELSLGEIAFLAALPKAPNNYNPEKYPRQAKERRDWVLFRMYQDGYIDIKQLAEAQAEGITMAPRQQNILSQSGYYAEEVRRFVTDKYGEEAMYNGGLFIRTSLDPHLQAVATDSLQKGLLAYDKRHGWRGAAAHFETTEMARAQLKVLSMPAFVPKNWQYAFVLQVSEENAKIEFADGKGGVIPLKNIKWARKALDKGKISKDAITSVGQVLSVGDVVYVSPLSAKEATYELQQVPEVEGALVAINPHTGRVMAMSGGFSFYKNQFNRAVQAYRQPGSAFKPFVYLAALDSGYTPSSLILDAPIVMEQPDGSKWKPKNYSKIFYGPTTLRVGLEKSRNLMTIRLAQAIGIRKVINYARKFRISEKLDPVLATALGSGETTLLKLTAAYGMLVNGGKLITPNFIDRIQDRDGKTIYKHDNRPCPGCVGDAKPDVLPLLEDTRLQVQDPVSAYQIVNILSGVIERGTGRSIASLKKVLAGKSGTSNDSVDAWFIGFSPDLVVGVWVGFDQPKTLGPNDTGGVVAAPIFKDFMAQALENQPNIPFRVPPGVRLVRVNVADGKPVAEGDKAVIQEAFRMETDMSKPMPILGEDITIQADDDMPDVGGVY
jgi:penicillin-binding protein 1A